MSINLPASIFGARCDIFMDIVVILFELDMKQNGGIFEMVKGSAYEGTFFLLDT